MIARGRQRPPQTFRADMESAPTCRVDARHRPGNAAASPLSSLFLASAPLLCYSIGNYHTIKELYYERAGNSDAVQDIFRDNFDDDTLEITRSTCADDIEDWDSLEQINLLTAIEKKFNIKFKLADVRGLKDVGDLLDLVARMV